MMVREEKKTEYKEFSSSFHWKFINSNIDVLSY